jgi:hypothetical protein
MMYTAQYFLTKLEPIPEEDWCVDHYKYHGACCAMGHCGAREGERLPDEARALQKIFLDANMCVGNINDTGFSREFHYEEPTPKQRILAALRDIQAKGG